MDNNLKNRSAHEKMLLALSLGTSLWILPFIIFRILEQDWVVAILDIIIALGMLTIFFYVYQTRRVKVVSVVLILIALIGNIISFYIKGVGQIYWLVAYYLIEPRKGILINFVLLLFYLPKLYTIIDLITFTTIMLTVLITNMIAFVFASNLRKQEAILLRLASEDYLTSTGNRRALDHHMQELYKKLKNHDLTASIVLLDIDNFKYINDKFGHIVGDQVLVNLSQLLRENCRKETQIFRFGGEEFLLICHDSDIDKTFDRAENYRKLVKNTIKAKDKRITISLGVAEYLKEETIKEWIHRVDLALYQAKNQGKNRTIKA